MKMAVLANDALFLEWNQHVLPATVQQTCFQHFDDFIQAGADVYVDLLFEPDVHRIHLLATLQKPVVINSVQHTIQNMEALAHPFFIRINAWPGFLKRNLFEVASIPANEWVDPIFETLQWNKIAVPDTVGLVSARVVAMMINEAWLVFEEGVATIKDIDIAMQQGTNYPYGPFEWSKRIGLQHIIHLLHQLSKEDIKYEPAVSLVQAAKT